MEVKLFSITRDAQRITASGEKKTEKVTYYRGDPEFDTYEAEMLQKRREMSEVKLPKNFLIFSECDSLQMTQKINTMFEQFHGGDLDVKAVEKGITSIVEKIRSTYVELGFDPEEFTPQVIEDVYTYARLANIRGASVAGFYDAQKIAVAHNGHNRNTKDWIYYDAKYYYSSEEMKDTLKEISKNIAEKYGVDPSKLELEDTYPDGDVRKGIYTSYNTIVCDSARNTSNIGSMIDETMVPPKGFRFFYKGNESGNNKLVPKLPAPRSEPGDAFDGVLQVWYGGWSFTGRVPVRENPHLYPTSVNMLDVVTDADPTGTPDEIKDFLSNFDFFTVYLSGRYADSHPRKI